MPKKRSWSDDDLIQAVEKSKSYRSVLIKLGLIPAGGNYDQIKRRIQDLQLSIDHFTGKGWSAGVKLNRGPLVPLDELLTLDSNVQSFKLKSKLFAAGVKKQECELCGWCDVSIDGRVPLELDHMNGDRKDNRLENLRILCPNCHSLQPTHRGRNKKVRYARVVE